MASALVFLHVLAGAAALAAGFLALYSEKGRTVHRRAGRVFANAMLVLTGTGTLISLALHPNRATAITGLVTFYLVASGLLTVIRKAQDAPRLYDSLYGLGFLSTVAAWGFGLFALGLPGRTLDHIPAPMLFLFAAIGTLAVIGDARLLRAGGIEGLARLRRHSWRMNFAMWVATSSFFLGQARQLPQWFRDANLNGYLVLLVTATLVYWLFRLRKGSERIVSRQATATPASVSANNSF
jgi:uncharacterized membrane protein